MNRTPLKKSDNRPSWRVELDKMNRAIIAERRAKMESGKIQAAKIDTEHEKEIADLFTPESLAEFARAFGEG